MADKQSHGSEGVYATGLLSRGYGQAERKTKQKPYASKIPNAESLEALRHLQAGEITHYNSVKEMMDDILSDE